MTRDTSERRADDPLGPLGDIYRPSRWRRSRDIIVAGHREILVWPLVLRLDATGVAGEASHERIRRAIDATAAALNNADQSPWEPVDDLLRHAPRLHTDPTSDDESYRKAQDEAQIYSEFVYFYDFLQQSLYRPGPNADEEPPFRLWRRTDVTALEVELAHWTGRRQMTAKVERFNLYLFSVGAAVAVLELDFDDIVRRDLREKGATEPKWVPDPITLADTQLALDHLRRAYTPYFEVNPPSGEKPAATVSPQGVPVGFTWRTAKGPIEDPELSKERQARAAPDEGALANAPPWTPNALCVELDRLRRPGGETRLRRTAPLADHWRQVLRPLVFAGYRPDVDRGEGEAKPDAVWRHILDERIPVMSWTSLTGAARKVTDPGPSDDPREDLRLVSRGDWVRLCFADAPGNDPLPYAPHFLADFETEHCYDRFFPSDATDTSTRYMFAGYHFAVVGAGERYFDKLIVHHFRRHYFQMALLANMELAALLATSSRITVAVDRLEKKANESRGGRAAQRAEFRRELMSIQEDFLTFVHRFRFTDVSNQIQPSELYRKWRRAMRLDGLYEDVKDELAAAVSFAVSDEQAETGRDAARLSAVATLGMPLALAFSFVPIFAEVIKNSDRFAPSPPTPGATTPRVPFDWFGSLLWASWPMLLSVAFFTFVASRSLTGLLRTPAAGEPKRSIGDTLVGAGIIALGALGIVLFQLLSR